MGKRKSIRKAVLLGSVVCLVVLFSFSSVFAQKKRINIGGASAGGTFYPLAVGMAEIINKYLPEYNAIALETGGALENIRLVAKGEIEIATANARDSALGFRGEKPFTTPLKNLRVGFYLGTFILHVVTLEKSKIKTLEDLKGKVINVGPPGSIVASTTEVLLRLHNISMKDVKVRHLGYSEAMEAMADGLVDAAALYSLIPSSAVNSLAVRQKIRLVGANEKILEAASTKETIVPFYVPPESYKGQTDGVFAWAVVSGTYFSEGTSEEDVYRWTKMIVEHKDELQKVHPMGKGTRLFTKKEAGIHPFPVHPGVVKYAKEVGISY